ncbi:RimJ/RimL family protein N-acetyltransferase, partial [Streptomyces sp. TRM76130]|nr:RimJ/RimL family protein N-acetyltransferase [Streptomyces sp. TRM76130]
MPHDTSRWLAEGPRVGIRHLTLDDGAEFTARTRESKDLHRPWLFPPDSAEDYARYAARLIEDPAKAGFLVCEKVLVREKAGTPRGAADGAIAGFININ